MIVRPRQNWLRTLFVWRGSVLPLILPRLGVIFAISVAVVQVHGTLFDVKVPLNPAPFTLIGIALAIFLGFRNSAGYDRWWEGRKLWGALLNESRTLTRQALTLTSVTTDPAEVQRFVRLTVAMLYALKHQLRGTDDAAELRRLLGPTDIDRLTGRKFKPACILRLQGEWLRDRLNAGEIDSMTRLAFDQSLARVSDVIGACERIAGTPIPYAYTILLHRTVYIYSLALPFGLVDSIGWATPFFAVFIAYTFIALDEVVTQIEEPFGTDDHDLALDAITKFIEITVREMTDEAHGEVFTAPVDYRLS